MEFRKFKNGFTLTEILVVISIIILMSGIFFANYRRGGKTMALERATSKWAQEIRRVQKMAMSAKDINGSAPRYGVYFELFAYSYILFIDLNNNGIYDGEPTDSNIEIIKFGSGIRTSDPVVMSCPGPPVPSGTWHITFAPPDPTTEIRVGTGNSNKKCSGVTLRLATGPVTNPIYGREISIYNSGMIGY